VTLPFVKGIDANLTAWSTAQWGSQGARVASEVRSLGATWDRESLTDYYYFDAMLPYAQAARITVLPVIPGWRNTADISGFASFVAQMAARYGPGTRANLRYFEIWNEPFYATYWNGATPDPAQYARLYAAAVVAARQANPRARFLIAADDMFAAVPKLGSMVDGVAFHPYGDDPSLGLAPGSTYLDTAGGSSFARIDTARESMLAHNVDVPFWISEVGWSSNVIGAAAQTTYYRHLYEQVAKRPWIRALFIHALRDTKPAGTDPLDGYGLESYPGFVRKPAWEAAHTVLTRLN
jgi:hypothetical protein